MSDAGGEGGEATVDAFLHGRLALAQPRRGARVGMDPFLLAAFAVAHGQAGARAPARLLDLGTGTGVVALCLLGAWSRARAVGVELQPAFATLAAENAARNHLSERFNALIGDYRGRLPLPGAGFELVVANPPYQAQGRGRVPAAADRALARAESAATLDDLARAAARHLAPRGRACVILPAGRLAEWFAALAAAKLAPKVVRAVHSVADEPAKRVLVAAARGFAGAVTLWPPLVVHGADRRACTAEVAGILDGTFLGTVLTS